MFRSIVSNLSLSPSATTQLAYYYRRLKGEQLTRQLSIVMAVAVAGLQVMTVIAPPDPANAAGSTNDIIRGGIGGTNHPQATMLHYYDNNGDIKAILNRYGINRNDIENTKHGTMNSSNHSIKSLGRNPHPNNKPGKNWDTKVVINGTTYYLRPLYSWGDNITYNVIEGRRAIDGKYFAIMINCGNIAITDTTPAPPPKPDKPSTPPKVTPKPPTPAPQPVPTPTPAQPVTPTPITPVIPPPTENLSPNISTLKTGILTRLDGSTVDANGATAQAGETVTYTVSVTNSGTATEKSFVIRDNVRDIQEYADIVDTENGVLNDGIITWAPTDIAPGASLVVHFAARIKSPLPATPAALSDPRSYDLQIDNVYEKDSVSTKLTAPTVAKQVEVASAALPQTGSGSSTFIIMVITAIIGFLFFRNRQLIYEVSILRHDQGGPR